MPGIGYDQTGGFPFHAVEACLSRAGLTIADVHELAIVEERVAGDAAADDIELPTFDDANGDWRAAIASLPVRRIDPVDADARQCAAATDVDDVLVFSSDPAALVAYRHAEGGLRLKTRVERRRSARVRGANARTRRGRRRRQPVCGHRSPVGSRRRGVRGGHGRSRPLGRPRRHRRRPGGARRPDPESARRPGAVRRRVRADEPEGAAAAACARRELRRSTGCRHP